ncbi:hypothetical protein OG806_43040 [Streptomyces sp. NBC_00882]|uniref:DUF6777 domain-containing protein n=1 Tax=Streptomyces TaxID=1883 RepID=UPI00386A8F32|nr:hypothetical protein OH837_06335 [Streptomyces canus]WSZ35710.1 hypothetical protein OG806_43040 [Streptomyces sp. NBC_00882]WSZ62645.1 hypothetical protein OH824_41955 [Streptomyces canus]
MRTPTQALVTACALAAVLLVAGCAGDGDANNAEANGEVFLQPAAARGPSPFTRSTATSATVSSPLTRTPQRVSTAPRTVSGGMPGLYSGIERVGSCDVARQLDDLTADRSRERAFAQVVGVSPDAVPDFLRGLAPVVLRADTLVTNHRYRAGRASGYPSVLQAGTAVLVDDRGVPRVRCACGNPLTPPVAMRGRAVVGGQPWPGYRAARVVVVAPSEQFITYITIIDLVDHTWIERLIDYDCRHDHVVPLPQPESPTLLSAPATPLGQRPDETAPPEASPSAGSGCATPAGAPGVVATEEPYDENCPTATPPPTTGPGLPAVPPDGTRTTVPVDPDPETGIGPETVPDTPDLPDGGGLIPDDPSEPAGTDAVFTGPAAALGV